MSAACRAGRAGAGAVEPSGVVLLLPRASARRHQPARPLAAPAPSQPSLIRPHCSRRRPRGVWRARQPGHQPARGHAAVRGLGGPHDRALARGGGRAQEPQRACAAQGRGWASGAMAAACLAGAAWLRRREPGVLLARSSIPPSRTHTSAHRTPPLLSNPQVRTLVKPLLGMFHGEPRAKKWRAAVSAPRAAGRGGRGTAHRRAPRRSTGGSRQLQDGCAHAASLHSPPRPTTHPRPAPSRLPRPPPPRSTPPSRRRPR